MTIGEIIKSYSRKLDRLDTELILAYSLGKTREFILTHPEKTVSSKQQTAISKNIARRMNGEPIAYITGHKEFYGLDFFVNKDTLVPRPETELLVEEILRLNPKNHIIIDIGTGSGNIIVSLAKNMANKNNYFGIDISKEALKIAWLNAKKHKTDKKIIFAHGDLLEPILKNSKFKIQNLKLIILANLPYLSKKIYSSTPNDVKKYEPKSALYSSEAGLAHYHKLLEQIKKMLILHPMLHVTCLWEISPEQKLSLAKLIKNILPSVKIIFTKDLAGKWRICKINL